MPADRIRRRHPVEAPMNQGPRESGEGPGHRDVEIAVAALMGAFGIVAIVGSLQVGIDWGVEGPRAGFFPFYVGLAILISSAVNVAQAATRIRADKRFAQWGQLRSVTYVVAPTAVYVVAIPYLGMYVASGLLIALFMKWLGRYPWALTLGLSLGVPALTFVTFEKWFLVALPKGPIENWLGF
jgi:hypothetical protein